MQELINGSQEILLIYGMKILAAISIFIIGKWLARMLTRAAGRLMEKSSVDATLITFLSNLSYATLLIFVVLAALNQLGIQTTSFIAVIGAAGLAIGLAMQDSLSNFAAGIMLIIFRPSRRVTSSKLPGPLARYCRSAYLPRH